MVEQSDAPIRPIRRTSRVELRGTHDIGIALGIVEQRSVQYAEAQATEVSSCAIESNIVAEDQVVARIAVDSVSGCATDEDILTNATRNDIVSATIAVGHFDLNGQAAG